MKVNAEFIKENMQIKHHVVIIWFHLAVPAYPSIGNQIYGVYDVFPAQWISPGPDGAHTKEYRQLDLNTESISCRICTWHFFLAATKQL